MLYPTYSAAEKAAKAYASKLNAEREPRHDWRPFVKGLKKFREKYIVYAGMSGDPMVAELDLDGVCCPVGISTFRHAD